MFVLRGKSEVKCYSHYFINTFRLFKVCTNSIIFYLLHPSEVVWVKFIHCKVSIFFFSILCSLEVSHYAQPAFKEWGVTLPLLRMEFYITSLEFFCRGEFVLSPIYLFTQSFIYINIKL